MRKILLILSLIPLSASADLAPKENRQLVSTMDSIMKKDQLFDATLEWLAKNFNDSNYSVKMKERESGRIIAKGHHLCGIGSEQEGVDFDMDFRFKDKKVKASFEDVWIPPTKTTRDAANNPFEGLFNGQHFKPRPETTEGARNLIKNCIRPISESYLKHLRNAAASDSDW